ncbi:hypothetical protein M9H77_26661 [Catharanthus roseus]|uniref:Uncharacterized protein n=1 Tax=Catharanthus roseus TaxID=4058 RepID=A0ACC0AAB8_CATRO|nr:hypothetical protein M9H77_26661 [Catharanthus roseus]
MNKRNLKGNLYRSKRSLKTTRVYEDEVIKLNTFKTRKLVGGILKGDYYGILMDVIVVEFSCMPVQTAKLFKCDWFDSSVHPVRSICFCSLSETSSYIMYLHAKRERSDWWVVMKSRPPVFYVPVVDVAFQKNVDIIETFILDRRIEDIGTLVHEIGKINEVDILGEPKDN